MCWRAGTVTGPMLHPFAALHENWPVVVEVSEKDLNRLDLLEVLKILEPRTAAPVAARAFEHQLRETADAQAALDDESIPRQQAGRLDLALHTAIIEASGNSILNGVHQFLAPYLIREPRNNGTKGAQGRPCGPITRPSWRPSAANPARGENHALAWASHRAGYDFNRKR